jgi:sarcosine oxidase
LNQKKKYDVIVIGVGSMGASTCYYLSKGGYSVLGLEQFDISHEFGSHAGQSRIIRKAYFEHPDYVPLLDRAYENWAAFEIETGEQLYFNTGLLYSGKPGNEMIKGVKQSASLYNIPLERPGGAATSEQFPQFNFPEHYETVFEPGAGFIKPEKAIQLYAQQAKLNGAIIHTNEKVIEWEKDGDGMVIKTNKDIYHCSKLVITAGAWAGKMISQLSDKIKVTRQFVAWIKPKHPENFLLKKFPCWMIADENSPGCYYGFPKLSPDEFGPPEGMKLAHHYPEIVTDPDNVNRNVVDKDIENLKYVVNKYFPGEFDGMLSSKICLYANSPDEHFIIDLLPGYEENVCIACGFSGHGFKFASVVGEILSDLAIDGKTKMPIEFLNPPSNASKAVEYFPVKSMHRS